VAYNIQNGKNKIKLLMEYENVTQNILLVIELILQIANKQENASCIRSTSLLSNNQLLVNMTNGFQ
jgi:hypothetical protein